MFESFPLAPPDPILGLNEAFQKDARTDKVNLGVGVYMDDNGKTPTMAVVREAERRILDENRPKTYLPIPGSPKFGTLVQELLFLNAPSLPTSGRAVTAQSPGGTGALRTAGDLIAAHKRDATLWLSNPTWENHVKVFEAAGLQTKPYRYWKEDTRGLDLEGMLSDLKKAKPGDVVLLHGSCHNPTGVDPNESEWCTISSCVADGGLLPFVDLAYQGLGDGLREDLVGVDALLSSSKEMIVASSFSKSLGLYGERTGALTVIAADEATSKKTMSQLKIAIRTNYSNPARQGGAIVETVLSDQKLRADWEIELSTMRARIQAMRKALVDGLATHGVARDVSFFMKQKGMFSYTGLSPTHVDRLRDEFGIYMVRSGRINVAGLTSSTVDKVCRSIATVLAAD